MTYNKALELKTILMEFLNKRIIDLPRYIEMLNNVENCQIVEDFLIECITKFNISYKDFPLDYKTDIAFLRRVSAVRPAVIKELKKNNKTVYNALFTNLSLTDKELTPNLEPVEKQKVRGVIKLTFDKQVG